MHEFSFAHQIISAVLAEATKHGLKRVEEVTINYNRDESLDPEMIGEHLEEIKDDSFFKDTNFRFVPTATNEMVIANIKGEY